MDTIQFLRDKLTPRWNQSTMKRRIRQNRWDNWYGYEGTQRVVEFGTDYRAAKEWLLGGAK
jgi:hypothetical protein